MGQWPAGRWREIPAIAEARVCTYRTQKPHLMRDHEGHWLAWEGWRAPGYVSLEASIDHAGDTPAEAYWKWYSATPSAARPHP